jgi:hypothetical protein
MHFNMCQQNWLLATPTHHGMQDDHAGNHLLFSQYGGSELWVNAHSRDSGKQVANCTSLRAFRFAFRMLTGSFLLTNIPTLPRDCFGEYLRRLCLRAHAGVLLAMGHSFDIEEAGGEENRGLLSLKSSFMKTHDKGRISSHLHLMLLYATNIITLVLIAMIWSFDTCRDPNLAQWCKCF